MKRFLFSSVIVLLLIPGALFSQRDSLRTVFLDAESWFLFEEYADALPLYLGLQENDPNNYNLNYKIGICLLNDPYQKDQSIKYLLKACDSINTAYKENNYKERSAPPDALYYLGDAYLVNELLDMAIESYQSFLEIMDRDVYDEELVQVQIRACENAKRLKSMPVDLDLLLLDSLINTRYSDIHPVVSGDGTKLVFITELPFYDGAFYCEKTDEGWSYPQFITQSLGFDADIYPVCLSHDGTEMILYYDDEYIGNLYYSKFEEGRWIPATKLGENISTKFWESHACFSNDGQILYFTSNRKGTYGGLDIYASERRTDGTWGVPENLGPNINSKYNEETPFLTEDGQTLYFSSYGHFNMGGYDIFYSKKDADGSWGKPINLGYPINTTDDDLFFQPVNNGISAYYSLYSPSGRGRHDIYYMNIYSTDNPRIYFVSGNLRTSDGFVDSTKMAIYVVDSKTGDTIMYTAPGQETGEFSFNLQQGIYELLFTGEGYEGLIRPLHITMTSDKQGIKLSDDIELALIEKEPVIFEGEESLIYLEDTLYQCVLGETTVIPFELLEGSTLITRVYKDSVLIRVDTVKIDTFMHTLALNPLADTTLYVLELIDLDGNIHRSDLTVVCTAPVLVAELGDELQEGSDMAVPEDQVSPEDTTDIVALDEVGEALPQRPEEALDESVEDLGKQGDGKRNKQGNGKRDRQGKRKIWPVTFGGLAGLGFLFLIILWWRRRKNKEN
jgi:tetratricopeptide (TPR) repeat protein